MLMEKQKEKKHDNGKLKLKKRIMGFVLVFQTSLIKGFDLNGSFPFTLFAKDRFISKII